MVKTDKTWVIQDEVFGEEQERLIEALKFYDINFIVVSKNCKAPTYLKQDNVILRGSVEFVNSNPQYQTINLEHFQYSTYSYWINNLLNQDFLILPWYKLYNNTSLFPECKRLFIRPNSGIKIFTGTCLNKSTWNKELDIIKGLPNSIISYDTLVVIAPYKEIDSEYRLLMYGNKLIDYSLYSGKQASYENIQRMKLLSSTFVFYPKRFYTIDICLCQNELKVVEINSFNSSGFYEMNYHTIVKEVTWKNCTEN
jgi:hypothetical protein